MDQSREVSRFRDNIKQNPFLFRNHQKFDGPLVSPEGRDFKGLVGINPWASTGLVGKIPGESTSAVLSASILVDGSSVGLGTPTSDTIRGFSRSSIGDDALVKNGIATDEMCNTVNDEICSINNR